MCELDAREIEILRAISNGCDTPQKIRPQTSYTSPDAVRHRCKRLATLGLLRTWIGQVRPAKGRPRWGSRARQRYYDLTEVGVAWLKEFGEEPEVEEDDEAESSTAS